MMGNGFLPTASEATGGGGGSSGGVHGAGADEEEAEDSGGGARGETVTLSTIPLPTSSASSSFSRSPCGSPK